MTSNTPYPPQTPGLYATLAVYWFALSFLWAGLLSIVMQTQVERFAPLQKDLWLSVVLASGALVSTIVSLIAGALSDRSRRPLGRRRPYIIVGTLLSLPVLLLLMGVNSIVPLVAVFCLLQFTINIATPPSQALVPDMVPKSHQGAASAYMGMGSLLGTLGGLMLCGLLISRPGGLQTICLSLVVLLLGAMLIVLWRLPENPPRDDGPRPSIAQAIGGAFQVRPSEHPDFFRLVASRFVISIGFYSAQQFLLFYVKDTLRPPDPAGAVTQIFLVATVAGLVGNYPAGILSDRYSKKTVLYASSLLSGIAAVLFMLAATLPQAMVAAFFFGAGLGAFQAVDWALATNLLPEQDEAKYMGVWNMAFTVPQVIAPIAGGLVAHWGNSTFGQGVGYRLAIGGVLFYLIVGTWMVRPIRERDVS